VTHARDGSLILFDIRALALAIVSETHDRQGRFPVERLGRALIDARTSDPGAK
jgi:hypothetical protein